MIKSRHILTLIILLLTNAISFNSYSAFTKIWDKRYGGDNLEYSRRIYETLDHGFLVCGSSYSSTSFNKTDSTRGQWDFWVVRTNSSGNVLWDKTYGGGAAEDLTCVILLPDSGFLIGGSSFSNASGEKSQNNFDPSVVTCDFWIIKIDKNGNKVWDKCYGGNKNEALKDMAAFPDGSILLAGTTMTDNFGIMTHPIYGYKDYWVVKIDPIGNVLWNKNYGGSETDELTTVEVTNDYGFVIGGMSFSGISGSKTQTNIANTNDYWIVKADSAGTQLWDKTFGGDKVDYLYTLNVLPNDYLLLGGISQSNIGYDKSFSNHGLSFNDYWFIKTDSVGTKLWDKVYGGDGVEDELDNCVPLDNGFLISGPSYSNISGDKTENNVLNPEQAWLLAIDSLGDRIWDKTIHSVTHLEVCYGIVAYDGCFVVLSQVADVGGDVSSSQNSYQDYWIAKFCKDYSPPTIDFVSSSGAICQNECVSFTNYTTSATSYQWFFFGGIPSSSTQIDPQNICYSNPGTYDVILIASNLNGADTLTLTNYLTVHPPFSIPAITQNTDTLFTVPGYPSYQWYSDSTIIIGANSYYFVAPHSGNYSVVVSNLGCDATAQISNVIASANDLNRSENTINIFSSAGNIYFEVNNLSDSKWDIQITNSLGKIVFQKNVLVKSGENVISLADENISSGVYFVSMQNADQVFSKKIFVEKN